MELIWGPRCPNLWKIKKIEIVLLECCCFTFYSWYGNSRVTIICATVQIIHSIWIPISYWHSWKQRHKDSSNLTKNRKNTIGQITRKIDSILTSGFAPTNGITRFDRKHARFWKANLTVRIRITWSKRSILRIMRSHSNTPTWNRNKYKYC